MIDTINIKLHNLPFYLDYFEALLRGKNMTLSRQFASFDFGTRESEFSSHKLTSGSYKISYQIQYTNGFCQFEFSLPKYFFKNNFCHFPFIEDETFFNSNFVYQELINGIKYFFLNEFNFEVNTNDIELCRIDLCYNYLFYKTTDFESYHLKLNDIISDNFGRENKLLNYSDKTTMYKTKNYSFKFYKKFDEYIFNKGKILPDSTFLNLKNTSRFEVTFRKAKLNEIFFDFIYCNQFTHRYNTKFKKYKETFLKCQSICEKLKRIYDNYSYDNDLFRNKINKLYEKKYLSKYLNVSFDDLILFFNKIDPLNKADRETSYFFMFINRVYRLQIEEYNKMISPKKIFLSYSNFEKIYQKTSDDYQKIIFDQDFFKKIFDFFVNLYTKINSFSISENSPLKVLNYKKSQIINFLTLRQYNSLVKYFSIMKTSNVKNVYSRSSIFDINQRINELKNHGISLTNYFFSEKPCFSFKNYYVYQKL